jgi:hypothetical protein
LPSGQRLHLHKVAPKSVISGHKAQFLKQRRLKRNRKLRATKLRGNGLRSLKRNDENIGFLERSKSVSITQKRFSFGLLIHQQWIIW